VEALKLLLQTPLDVDFTLTDDDINHQFTPLIELAVGNANPSAVKVMMLTAILDRVSSHSNDRIDWRMRDRDGDDFLDKAAFWGVLSDLYHLVKHQPYYVTAAKPFQLNCLPMDGLR